MGVQHDPHCLACRGRGHVHVDPTARGWTVLDTQTDGRRIWAHPQGGIHVFDPRLPEMLMIACACVQPRE
jgi:hypothetical protein